MLLGSRNFRQEQVTGETNFSRGNVKLLLLGFKLEQDVSMAGGSRVALAESHVGDTV